jgi:hypothetical protein
VVQELLEILMAVITYSSSSSSSSSSRQILVELCTSANCATKETASKKMR